jgi:hypothetical protein
MADALIRIMHVKVEMHSKAGMFRQRWSLGLCVLSQGVLKWQRHQYW